MSTDISTRRSQAAEVLAIGIKAADAYGRPELAAQLARRRERLDDTGVRVVVIGEFKAGKSTLINAALGADLCPTDDDIATAVPTIVRGGDSPEAFGIFVTEDGLDRVAIPFDERKAEIREDGPDRHGYTAIELSVPRAILSTGLELMDTPGVGGLRSGHTAAAIASVNEAEAVIFVTDASQELSAAELEVLRHVAARCPNLLVVLTKCDLFPRWRRILELDEAHLKNADLVLPIFPVSSTLRELAVEQRDDSLNEESGFADLLELLRDDVAAEAETLAIDQVVHDMGSAISALVETFQLELAVLDDPAEAARIEAELEEASERAERLKTQASRWQTTLTDGVSDLSTEVDHDLRARLRGITTSANERIDDLDPHQSWDEFTVWLEQQITRELLANHQLIQDRTAELTERVIAHFRIDESEVAAAPGLLADLDGSGQDRSLGALELERSNPVKQVLGGLRGSYSGLMMFGMLGGMAGIAIATPVLAGIGLFLGARQVRDERTRQMKAHRQQAQQSVRRHMDEITLAAGKSARDQMKLVQRGLRDHYGGLSGELQERVQHALASVRDARASNDRDKRRTDIRAELARLEGLQKRVDALCY
jgi:signal recognition particle receptor subunit beta